MRLYEEYCQRHGITSVPLAKHEQAGAIILRIPEGMLKNMPFGKWIMMTFEWKDSGVHPGRYVVEYSYPIHDGYLKGRLFNKYNVKELEWDEYEEYWLNWTKGLSLNGHTPVPVCSDREVILAAWEMFVYCYDGWICKQSSELKCYIHNSMDLELAVQQRFAGYQNSLIYLTARQPGALKAWKYDVLSQVQHYSHWLADLLKADGGKKILTCTNS